MSEKKLALRLEQRAPAKAAKTGKSPESAAGSPSSIYFQVHFEYLHAIINDLKGELRKTNQRLDALQKALVNRS